MLNNVLPCVCFVAIAAAPMRVHVCNEKLNKSGVPFSKRFHQ